MRLHHDKRNGWESLLRGLTSRALIALMLLVALVMTEAAHARAAVSAPAAQPTPSQERPWLATPMAMTVQVILPAVAVDGRAADPIGPADPAELPENALETRGERDHRGAEADQ